MFARLWSSLLVLVTFALVLLGGLVHTRGASLACPDWPLCYGMVLPPMQGDILLEHSHRLLASAVGLMVVGQLALVLRAGGAVRAQLVPWALAGLVLVLAQGLLGGITVILRLPPPVSIAHWSLSMVFFAWAVVMAWRLFEAERAARGGGTVERVVAAGAPAAALAAGEPRTSLRGAQLVYAAAAFVWLQGVVGAAVRHTHASLSCGQQALYCGDGLWPMTGPQWLQTSHRLLALAAIIVVGFGTGQTSRAARAAGRPYVRKLGAAVHALLAWQLLFGILTVRSGIKLHSVMAHTGGAAALFAVLIAMGLAAGRPAFVAGTARAHSPEPLAGRPQPAAS